MLQTRNITKKREDNNKGSLKKNIGNIKSQDIIFSNKRNFGKLIINLSFFLIVIFLSCKDRKKESLSTVFRYNEYANITSLDPAFAKDQRNIWAVNQLFNGLVQLNDSLQVEPDIAKRWHISDDGKVYEFILRKDVFLSIL